MENKDIVTKLMNQLGISKADAEQLVARREQELNTLGLKTFINSNTSEQLAGWMDGIDENNIVALKTHYANMAEQEDALAEANYYRENIKYAGKVIIFFGLVGCVFGAKYGKLITAYLGNCGKVANAAFFAWPFIGLANIYDAAGWVFRLKKYAEDRWGVIVAGEAPEELTEANTQMATPGQNE